MREIFGDMFNPESYKDADGAQIDSIPSIPDAICITTNGFVKKNGTAVMGKGCAAQAKVSISSIDYTLGQRIKTKGNRVHLLTNLDPETHEIYHKNLYSGARIPLAYRILSFPVKPVSERCLPGMTNVVLHMKHKFRELDIVPGWATTASSTLIRKSSLELVELANTKNFKHVVLPRPGCGAGELNWEDVKLILSPILDDRFSVITFAIGEKRTFGFW